MAVNTALVSMPKGANGAKILGLTARMYAIVRKEVKPAIISVLTLCFEGSKPKSLFSTIIMRYELLNIVVDPQLRFNMQVVCKGKTNMRVKQKKVNFSSVTRILCTFVHEITPINETKPIDSFYSSLLVGCEDDGSASSAGCAGCDGTGK